MKYVLYVETEYQGKTYRSYFGLHEASRTSDFDFHRQKDATKFAKLRDAKQKAVKLAKKDWIARRGPIGIEKIE